MFGRIDLNESKLKAGRRCEQGRLVQARPKRPSVVSAAEPGGVLARIDYDGERPRAGGLERLVRPASRFCDELGRLWLTITTVAGCSPATTVKRSSIPALSDPTSCTQPLIPLTPHAGGLSPAVLIHYSYLDGRLVMP